MNKNKIKQNYIDVKNDSSLEERFYLSVKILATEMGSLNKRLFRCEDHLSPFFDKQFNNPEINKKFAYIENVFKNKCMHYNGGDGGWLHCHWKESKKMAENIFYIFDKINEIVNE